MPAGIISFSVPHRNAWFDQVRPAIALIAGETLSDELGPASLQGQRTEVPTEHVAIEAVDHVECQMNNRDLIGHLAVLDVVLFTVAEVRGGQLDDRQIGRDRDAVEADAGGISDGPAWHSAMIRPYSARDSTEPYGPR